MFIVLDVFENNSYLRYLVESRILPRKGYLRVQLDNVMGACKSN